MDLFVYLDLAVKSSAKLMAGPKKFISKGSTHHIVAVFFNLMDDYEPNITPQKRRCLNKVGKNIGR